MITCSNKSFVVLSLLSLASCLVSAKLRSAEIDVYIITGQSNSLGTTGLESPSSPGSEAADAQTQLFWSNVRSTNSNYPPTLYGTSGGSIVTLQTQQGDGGVNPTFWGPEFGLARRLFEHGDRDVMVIKASRGGGGNSFWDKGVFESNANNGHMWGHLRDTVDAGLSNIDQSNTFAIRGLIYLQGESNSANEAAIADTRLQNLASNLKTHIHATYPDVADNMHTVIGEIAASGTSANRILTTQLQSNLAAASSEFSFVSTSDLPLKSDGIHFGKDAKLTIGERFANAFIAVSDLPNDVVGDVNQDGILSSGSGDPLTDDVAAFVAGWRSITAGLTNRQKTMAGDLNLSGQTTLADAFILHNALEQQGQSFPFQKLSTVPEPTSSVFVVGFSLSLVIFQLKASARAVSRSKLPSVTNSSAH